MSAISEPFPNVIWIFGDQHRAQALGYRGDPNVRTPHIDSLADRGVRFDHAVAGAPWCTPFRGALFTGRYPHQIGCTRTPSPAIDPTIPTITRPLRDKGYHTALVGKWHLAGSNAEHFVPPEHRGGFDYWMGFETGNTTYNTMIHGNDHDELIALPGFHTDAVTDIFLRHLRGHFSCKEHKPFFGVLGLRAPHDPYESPPPFDRHRQEDLVYRPNVPDVPWVRERTASHLPHYYGMIENLDWNVGRVIQTLRQLEVDRSTWILFFSDHGDSHGSHAMFQKSNPYEESIKIPMIIAPASEERATRFRTCDAVMNHVDIAPTTLGLCGIARPAWMVGHDYAAYPLDRSPPPSCKEEPDSAYLQQIHPKRFPMGIDTAWRGVITRDGWKYVCTPDSRWLMFDLKSDPYEQANLVFNTRFMDRRSQLHDRLVRWVRDTRDDFSLPPSIRTSD